MYVRTVDSGGRKYRQLVEGRREGGRVKIRLVATLGEHERPEHALDSYVVEHTRLRQLDGRTPSQEVRFRRLEKWIVALRRALNSVEPITCTDSGKPANRSRVGRRLAEDLKVSVWAVRLFDFVRRTKPDVAEEIEAEVWRRLADELPTALGAGFELPQRLRRVPVREWRRASR